MSYIDFKKCIRCGNIFDIATNFNLCPECRIKEINKKRENGTKGKEILC